MLWDFGALVRGGEVLTERENTLGLRTARGDKYDLDERACSGGASKKRKGLESGGQE